MKLLLRSIVFTVLAGSNLIAQCGVERWSVKTGTDANAKLVNLNSATPTTISSLRALPAPKTLPANSRIQPTETTVFVVNATLVEFALESDSDYHLVISDASGNTMITEIPAPNCVGAGSPFASDISASRAAFNARFTSVTSNLQRANIPVQIEGVGFFDTLHGQAGVAPNGIELHPVLSIKFNPSTSPDFTLAASGALNIQAGSSGTTTILAMPSNGFNATLVLSASGLPGGASASFMGTIQGGSGSANLTVTVGASVPAGNYTVAVTATGGGVIHVLNVPLTVRHR